MGELTYFLGLQVKSAKNGIFIHQSKYCTHLLKKFRMLGCKEAATPMATNCYLDLDKAGKDVDQKMYREAQEKVTNPLFEKRPKQFGIGGVLPPKRDLTRFVKWPKTVQIQRKKRILKQRLKVPLALNHITKTLNKNLGQTNFYSVGSDINIVVM
ncbi:60S ribosomal protein L7a-1-like [Vigna radiata var. radiata]|uniref:60S ribosomal protein L7a n=1 Tax=Vigna radiata var. radiata TaxID=3916 RepID=A0A1S3UAP7_VIGRR|nr:60S ribosomal protein L7a-1-like [Vigna radiata var. radiata]